MYCDTVDDMALREYELVKYFYSSNIYSQNFYIVIILSILMKKS